MSDLASWGWTPFFQASFAPFAADCAVGRVVAGYQNLYRLYTPTGERLGSVAGKLRFQAVSRADFPAVGDWVAYQPQPDDRAVIIAVLPRRSKFSRQVAGLTGEEQVVAANVDTLLIVSALNQEFNLRRLERYLVLGRASGADPVVVLNKADMCLCPDQYLQALCDIAPDIPAFAVSCREGQGLEALQPYLLPGRTVALVGSSGVGKSSLINCFFGQEYQMVQPSRRQDERGRHTTTHRELVQLPQGGLWLDTPGMRELKLWDSADGFAETFADIEALAEQCRFRDCRHQQEPSCAIQEALAAGELDPGRFKSYIKLGRELAFQERSHKTRRSGF